MSDLRITAGPFSFTARWEEERAPKTVAAFRAAAAVPTTGSSTCAGAASRPGSRSATSSSASPFENHTSYPAPGEILLYPGGFSETEILFPYGGTRFASIVGQLAGNHFLTIDEGREQLRELGASTLWEGAQDILFEQL